jgi:signal transduction histidine kinase/DNA-binding response OmpR family regulator/CHASE3 domain sensor protein
MKTNVYRNLQIGFGLSLLLLIVSSVASYVSIQNLLQSSNWVDHTNSVLANLEEMMSTMKDAETGQRGYLLTGESAFLEPYNGSYERALQAANNMRNLTADNPAEQKNVAILKRILLKRLDIIKQFVDKKQEGKEVTIADLKMGKMYMDSLRTIADTMRAQENGLLKVRTQRLREFTTFTPTVIVFAALLALSVSIFSYLKVTGDFSERLRLTQELEEKDAEITRRIDVIEEVAGKISQGDYKIRLDDKGEDNLGSIAVALNGMASSLYASFEKLEDSQWLQTGIAELNNRMVGEKDIAVLAADIMDFLAGYTHSQAGALYLLEDDKLKLKSAYALAGIADTVSLGEGLVGQAALSDREIWLKNIDEDYITVTHAVGQIKPKNLLVLPVHYENKVKGVIELASVEEYPDRKLVFLQAISSNIGIALASAENRKKLQELLEETQAQAEELQAQHSELENLNTELEAHAQKLQTSEEELRVQQEELQQTNQELEERNRLINERNTEIQKKAEELEQSTRYKSEFMANMSHELRTPLNSILLLSRYLAENNEHNLNEEQTESARVILNSGNGLLNLIDELLDLSKIEAGKMELEYEQVRIDDILGDMRSMFMPIARDRNLELILTSDIEQPAFIETDKMRLEQILKNLIGNALKFTPHGHIKLHIRHSALSESYLEFSVEDTGVGIPPDKQGQVFEAFKQADGSTKRKYGGTGLGLSISRELARLLGGEIKLSSEVGKGSNFTVIIPKNRPAAVAVPEPLYAQKLVIEQPAEVKEVENRQKHLAPVIPQPIADDRDNIGPKDKVILIVEDDTAFAKALLGFTRKQKYKGIVAVRGDQGIELAKQYKPLAILLDIQLPVKDGWEVMEEIKSDPETRPIPVHIMSSLEARRESRIKGAVDFINKPVAIEQMKKMFERLEDVLSKNPKKVLIVEENPKHALALSYFLESFNVSSAISSSVTDGISTLKNNQVNCVILDMGIPDKSAYETLEAVKRNEGLENLPIIVFTGKNLSSAEESRIKQYADSIVVKTAHSYERILDEVALFLHLVEENKKPKAGLPVRPRGPLNEILKDKTVLIADDDVRNIFSLTKSLEKYQMKVISATDGKEALQQLEQHRETDIVLMDMMMPEMDGYESTTKIRQNPAFKELPVIAVTAKAMMGDREKCITAGASDYISKPVDVDQLISLLRVWLYDKNV